jgi:hypothetical protein
MGRRRDRQRRRAFTCPTAAIGLDERKPHDKAARPTSGRGGGGGSRHGGVRWREAAGAVAGERQRGHAEGRKQNEPFFSLTGGIGG